MTDAWFGNTVAWISAHPVAASGSIFLIALCDALAPGSVRGGTDRSESSRISIARGARRMFVGDWLSMVRVGDTVLMRGEPLALDRSVRETMFALRNPLADWLMAHRHRRVAH